MIDLDALIRSAYELQPLSPSSTRLAALVSIENTNIKEVVGVIKFDQALTLHLLRIANSAAVASRTPISTINDAVMRLGMGTILSLAISFNVKGQMKRAVPEYGLPEGELWRHSIAAAAAAEAANAFSKIAIPHAAFTAALLHDIGKQLMAQFLNPEILGIIKSAQQSGVDPLTAESEVLRVHHGELGGLIAQHWMLPEPIVKGITNHQIILNGVDADPLCDIVYLSNIIAKLIGTGTGGADIQASDYDSVRERMGISLEGFAQWRAKVAQSVEEISRRYA